MNDPRFLKAFCEHTDGRQFHEPFSSGAYTFATDAVIAIRVPRMKSIAKKEAVAERLEGLAFPAEEDCALTLPDLPVREWTVCPERVTLAANSCPKSCPECGGLGRVAIARRIQIGLSDFNSEYLRSMKMFLRNVRTNRPNVASSKLLFTFNGGSGMLAAMQPFD